MAISYVSSGVGVAHTSAGALLNLVCPASVTANQLLVAAISNKYEASIPATPAGWTLVGRFGGGLGDSGTGAGTGRGNISIYYKIAVGNEGDTTIPVSISPAADVAYGRIFSFSKASDKDWDFGIISGVDESAGNVQWSITTGSWNVKAGDLLIAASFMNVNTTASSEACAMTGITFGTMTELQDSGSTAGSDIRLVVSSHPITTGDATGTLTYTYTAGASGSLAPAGVTAVLRLREVTPAAPSSRRIFNIG
jgi:hypothetical protein